MNTQLSLFDVPGFEETPLPVIVADKWKFPLQTHKQDDGNLMYSIQDWIAGLSGVSKSAAETWRKMNSQVQIDSRVMDYTATNNRVYQMDFTNDEGLYRIAQEMRAMKKRPQLQEIKDYLAKSGAFVDHARRNPADAAQSLNVVAEQRYLKQGKSPEWVQDRLGGIISHNVMTAALKQAVLEGMDFAKFTNVEYRSMFSRTAKEISEATGHKNARDGMTRQALAFLSIAEATLTDMLKAREEVTFIEACDMMRAIAVKLQPAMASMQLMMGADLATGKALLGGTR
jgi:hypothetical protein